MSASFFLPVTGPAPTALEALKNIVQQNARASSPSAAPFLQEMHGNEIRPDANGDLPMRKVDSEDWNLPPEQRDVMAREDAWNIKKEAEEQGERLTAREIAVRIAAMRDEAARNMEAGQRYRQASELAPDFADYMNENVNSTPIKNGKSSSGDAGRASFVPQEYTFTSSRGTVVGISAIAAENSASIQNGADAHIVQITRKDGFQLNFALEDDIRINDLEDGGLSVYYASSGITRIFDAEGRETVVQGEQRLLGTEGDDIIVNRAGVTVDAGSGDDVIVNLADNASLYGGAGNDKILLPSATTENCVVDGGAGDDVIVGQRLERATIVMNDGKDSLTAQNVVDGTVASTGDDSVKINMLKSSSLTSNDGTLAADLGSILESSLSISRTDDIAIHARGSRIVIGQGNISSFLSLNASELTLEKGTVNVQSGNFLDSSFSGNVDFANITATWVLNATLSLQGGTTRLEGGNVYDSTVVTDGGDDTFILKNISDSTLHTGDGDDAVSVSSRADRSTINVGEGDDNVWLARPNNTNVVADAGAASAAREAAARRMAAAAYRQHAGSAA